MVTFVKDSLPINGSVSLFDYIKTTDNQLSRLMIGVITINQLIYSNFLSNRHFLK